MQAKRPRAVDDLDLPILGDEQIPVEQMSEAIRLRERGRVSSRTTA